MGASGSRRLKVVTMIDDLTWGGAELMARTIALRLDRSRFEPIIVVTRPAVWDPEHLADADVRVLELPRRHRGAIWVWPRLVSFLRRERVDILHTHKFGSNVNGAIIGRLAGVPLVLAHEHTWSFEGEPLRKLLDRRLVSRLADAVLAVSEEDRRRMIDIERIDPDRIELTSISAWAYELRGRQAWQRDIRAELGIAPGAPVVGTVAVLRAQKALEVLIEAAARMREGLPEIQVLIAGEGPERQLLEARIDALGLGDTVHLLGHWSPGGVPDLLEQLDVFVNCSDFEGTPGNVLEAMAGGVPLVATRVGGTPGLVEEGVHGILVERRDPAALADAISGLLTNRARAQQLGLAAQERYHREFGAETMIARIEEIYERLWTTRARRRRDV